MLSWIVLVPQFCHRCGHSDGFDFHADDDLWEAVWTATGRRFGVLCLGCFVDAAHEMGLPVAGRTRLFLGRPALWFGLVRTPDPQDVRSWGGAGARPAESPGEMGPDFRRRLRSP